MIDTEERDRQRESETFCFWTSSCWFWRRKERRTASCWESTAIPGADWLSDRGRRVGGASVWCPSVGGARYMYRSNIIRSKIKDLLMVNPCVWYWSVGGINISSQISYRWVWYSTFDCCKMLTIMYIHVLYVTYCQIQDILCNDWVCCI